MYVLSAKDIRDPATAAARRRARKGAAEVVQPEVRELLDLIAELLAAEYIRLMKADQQVPRDGEV